MAHRPFVHLHCHTHYSLLDGASRVPELVRHVKSLGMTAVAMTDHGTLSGAIEFYRECRDAGLNPIIGYEAYVAPGKRTDKTITRNEEASYHLTLLARNRTGFKNLIKMASAAYLEGFYKKPRIDKELLEAHREGLICLSGCAAGEFSQHILKEDLDEACRVAAWFHKLFGNDFYVEIQNNGLFIQKRCMEGAVEVANRMGLPLVATSDAHYLTQADAFAHDVLLCINTGKKLSDEKRLRYGNDDGKVVDQFFVRGPEEMYALFPGHADAVQRSQEIANGVDIDIDFTTRHFPVFTPPGGKKPESYLRELCEQGLQERYRGNPLPAARQRLEHELDIICRMGFASYFLIVGDFVRFAVANGIPASARGSACGALVSYVLKLSHVDPLEYDLLFERFLDPNRSEAPDIDIDFCQDRRDEVIQYVKRKYGEQSVAQIATFGTLGAKAVIKDVGRVLDMPLDRVNKLTSLVPNKLHITLEEAVKSEPELRREYETDPDVKTLIDIALKLEGTNRQAGIHAAGVVISNGPLTDHVPLQRALRKNDDGVKNGEVGVATQWVMGDLEKVGLLKMDFLGLRTLTLLDNCVKLIAKTRGETIDLYNLPLDDPETYQLLQRGDAKGVFQLESEGIRELLKRMKPDNIRDIIAIMALYRPGPLQGGMVDSYVNCKHGRERPVYQHPVMEEVLAETYGVMVYQEQIMRILNRLGGIELSSAYACIKAISKKKQDIIDLRYAEFAKGARERGLTQETIDDIWNKIIVFAGYGFNKSHTAAYAQVGYQTAYLKAHYTPEFMAALLSSEIDDGNKRDIMVEHIADAKHLGVEVLKPDVNASEPMFTVKDGRVLFGLVAIKGLGHAAAAEIVRARNEGGRFKDLFDLCERIDGKIVTRAALERLIKAGACDAFGNRNQLMTALPRAFDAASELQNDRRRGQRSLFDAVDDADAEQAVSAVPLPDVPEWPDSEKLKYEKEALDFYFSSHPLAQHEQEIRRFATCTVSQLRSCAPGQELILGGMLTQVEFRTTKKLTRMCRCVLEDLTGSVKCVMWSDDLERHKDDVYEDRVCFVKATIDERSTREEPNLVLRRVMAVEAAQREFTRGLWLKLTTGEHEPAILDAIGRILRRTPGPCWVFMSVHDGAGKCVRLKLGEDFRVNPQAVAVGELETLLGEGCVKFAGTGSGGRHRNGH